MRKTLLFLVFCSVAIIASAQQNTTRPFQAFDTEKFTVDATAGGVGFTTSKINPSASVRDDRQAQLAECTVKCTTSSPCEITARADNTATLTATSGATFFNDGDKFRVWWYTNIAKFKAIRTGANSADLYCQYSR
jgi:hypothetical protein